jgi:HD-GYP domain-containing protein (c-di-GMP phosphodiesterase class II)
MRALIQAFQTAGTAPKELVETRCHRGAEIARKMRFCENVAQGIEYLDEHWDGSGLPLAVRGDAIPVYSRIALLSQVVDVFQTSSGVKAARREARSRAGGWFDPHLVAAFERVAAQPSFWDMLRSDDLQEALYSLEPAQETKVVDDDYLDDIAEAFADVIDSKSPYTSGHSRRVTLFTDMIAEKLQFSSERRRWLRRAALLHDIGKLGVSNSVLDKPGKLDEDEWAAMKMHAVYSEQILARIAAFSDLAPIAAAHHERLDGNGYPNGLRGDAISYDTRIITTADIFDALTADRPYRAAMPIPKALGIMDEMVGTAIDASCFDALRRAVAAFDATQAA